MSSNYPPGVSGTEPQIVGSPADELDDPDLDEPIGEGDDFDDEAMSAEVDDEGEDSDGA